MIPHFEIYTGNIAPPPVPTLKKESSSMCIHCLRVLEKGDTVRVSMGGPQSSKEMSAVLWPCITKEVQLTFNAVTILLCDKCANKIEALKNLTDKSPVWCKMINRILERLRIQNQLN